MKRYEWFSNDYIMKWRELSLFRKVMYVISLICLPLLIAWAVFSANHIPEDTRVAGIIGTALVGVFFLGNGMRWKSKLLRVLYYVLAGASVLVCLYVCLKMISVI